jgi:hypothetical protein
MVTSALNEISTDQLGNSVVIGEGGRYVTFLLVDIEILFRNNSAEQTRKGFRSSAE